MEKILASKENKFLAFLSIALAVNTFFFIAQAVKSFNVLAISFQTSHFYITYAILLALIPITLLFCATGFTWKEWVAKKLVTLFPMALLLSIGLIESNNFHYVFPIFVGFYTIAVGLYLIYLYHEKQAPKTQHSRTPHSWISTQKKSTLVLLTLLVFLNLGFGAYRVSEFAAVDEALWTFGGRITKYWKNIGERDWNGTRVSDKPGVTVSILSGAGLLFEQPKAYKPIKWEGSTNHSRYDIRKLNFALRFPIVLFAALMIPVLYYFLERLFGYRKALLSTILIATSPILIGITRIINPDSLLWIFAPLTLISYFAFLRHKHLPYLYWSGVFLGLSLLTKYVSNILFIFFFGLIFLEYILLDKRTRATTDFIGYMKKSFLHYFILTFIALSVVYALYPAMWIKPSRLLNATLLSQAFKSTWPLFIGIIAFIFADQWAMKNRITKAILDTLAEQKRWLVGGIAALFLGCVSFVVINVMTHMQWYDFGSILASPKSSFAVVGFNGVFLGNFYPLLFTIHPIALCAVFIFSVFLLRNTRYQTYTYRAGIYSILFILLYYLGTAVNHVASISRYQIMLYPIILILAGLALGTGYRIVKAYIPKLSFTLCASLLIICSGASTLYAMPLPSSYDSFLLPSTYHTNIKDMGDGSFEAAQYLNALPDAKTITIWSDKNGVCTFFVGNCYSSFNYANLKTKGIDYVVVTAGRQSRTTKMVEGAVASLRPDVIRFDQYYTQTMGIAYELNINNRPSNFVKVIPFHNE